MEIETFYQSGHNLIQPCTGSSCRLQDWTRPTARRRSCSSRRGGEWRAWCGSTPSPRRSRTQLGRHLMSVDSEVKFERPQTVCSIRPNCYFDLLHPLVAVRPGATKVCLGLGRVLPHREPPTLEPFRRPAQKSVQAIIEI